MIVRCSNCQTQFSLDDRQVGPDGAPVRCSVCAYVFRVEPPSGTAPLPWQVRTVDELTFSASDLATLRGWITEGRLHPDDKISRTGKHWIRLGDMPEFSEAFAGFSDLPEVLNPIGGPIEPDIGDLGPPPDFGGSNELGDGVVERVPQDASHGIDVSGLLDPIAPDAALDEEPTVAKPAPTDDDVVVRRTEEQPDLHEVATGFHGTSGTAKVHRDDVMPKLSEMEDSGAVTLPEPPPPPRRSITTPRPRDVTPAELAMPDLSLRESSAPVVGADRAPSMLSAVTEHVKPLSSGSGASEASASEGALPREPTLPGSPATSQQGSAPRRRRSMWPVVAGLGVLCGAAVVFGIPQVRSAVVGAAAKLAGAEPEREPPPPPALQTGRAALASGAPDELAEASTELEAALSQTLSPAHRAATQVTQVEVLATRALVLQLQAGLEGEDSAVRFAAADAGEKAGQVFAGTDVSAADADAVSRARARLRLAQGRPVDEILSSVPGGDEELRWLVTAGALWRDPQARVPSGLIGGLAGLPQPSTPAQLLLALAYVRGGDEPAASEALDEIDAAHPVAILLRAKMQPAAPPVADDGGPPDAGLPPSDSAAPTDESAGDSSEDPLADGGAAPPDDEDEPVLVEDKPAPMSVDRMISRGCAQVDAGRAKDGLKLLLRAFDRRPNDIDVLVCLADAHRKLGSFAAALRYYKQALSRSPRYVPALLGAARASTRKAKKAEALTYYRRLLAVSPSNAEAKSYIAKMEREKADAKAPKKEPETKAAETKKDDAKASQPQE